MLVIAKLLLPVAVALVLVGCGQQTQTPAPTVAPVTPAVTSPAPEPSSPPASPSPTTPGETPAVTLQPPSLPAPTPTATDGGLTPVEPTEDWFVFTAPSGNFYCSMTATQVFCNIWDTGKPKCKKDVEIAYVVLDVGKKAKVSCGEGDAGDDWNSPPLPYDHQVTLGPFRCEMRKEGATCVDTTTGHGVLLSKKKTVPID